MIPGTERQGQSINAAYIAIRSLIVEGRLGPGSRLVERDLAEHLEMSRSPVRSALLRLQQEGYVLSRGGERARLVVAPLTRADARELYRLLGFLDGDAAREAATLDSRARKTLVGDLRKTARELDGVARQLPFDARRFFDLDLTFHHHYLELPDRPRMMMLYRATRPQADRYRLFYSSGDHVGSLAQVSDEHRAIVAAIESGNPDGAERAARFNWQRAADRVCAIMNVAGERGNL
jgi:DNA-binding GntR family transcriptional regulator